MKTLLTLFVLLFSSMAHSNNVLKLSDEIPASRLDIALLEVEKVIQDWNKKWFKERFNLDMNVNTEIHNNYEIIKIIVSLFPDPSNEINWKEIVKDGEKVKKKCGVYAKEIFSTLRHLGDRNSKDVLGGANMVDRFLGKLFVSKEIRHGGKKYDNSIMKDYNMTFEEIGKNISEGMEINIVVDMVENVIVCKYDFNEDWDKTVGPVPFYIFHL